MNKIIYLSLLLVLITSCGKDNKGSLDLTKASVIVGALDWMEVDEDQVPQVAKEKARAVAYLDLPALGSRCTGSLINKNTILTNEHCVPSASHAVGVKAIFNYERGKLHLKKSFSCSTFIGNDRTLDYALLRCAGNPGLEFGHLSFSLADVTVGDGMYVLHQNCDYYRDRDCDPTKKYSEGSFSKLRPELTYNADTLGGSSGSPVFNKSNYVVGLHHAGRPTSFDGRGSENYAVPAKKIVASIKSRYPLMDLSVSGQTPSPSEFAEPNETIVNAFDFKRGSSFKVSNLKIATNWDKDFFKVPVSANGFLTVKIKFSHSRGDLDLKIFDVNGALLKKSESTSNDEEIELSVTSEVVVFVYGYNGAKAPYTLEVEYTPGQQQNHSFQLAQEILASSEVNSKIPINVDGSFYKFKIFSSQHIQVDLEFTHKDGDLDLKLYDSSFQELAKSNGVRDQEFISKHLTAGEYFLKVYGYKGASNTFSLELDF